MEYTTHIKAKSGWFDIDLKELFRYRDLVFLFVKRTYTTMYKQTILGPMWLILNPLITVMLYAFVFGRVAGLSTDGAPYFAFYLCSNAIWSFFATCITETSSTFTANAAILGKVYFPRLVMPISSVVTAMLNMMIQLGILVFVLVYYGLSGVELHISRAVLLIPVLIIQTGLLGLGCGIIVAALTTKYRDLVILVSFGVQLWMYASPVVYTFSQIPEKYLSFYLLNPMAPVITVWRHAILGTKGIQGIYWGISWLITVAVLFTGIILFSRIERTFMDTV
ncbi:MAG: ABC transporter permease [Lachnospiraceae bacterium]|nr:ABC transporter permease [Lachnospiraceae bacterium]